MTNVRELVGRTRGTRLPEDWAPSPELQTWAEANGVSDPMGAFLDDFRDYWRSLPGARGVKLDWDATYRQRVRQVALRPGMRSGRGADVTKQGYDPNAPWLKRASSIVQSAEGRAWTPPEDMP